MFTTIPGELSLSLNSLTALRVRAAEGSMPHRIGGGLLLGGVYEWMHHTRNHAYVYGVSCCFLIPHVSLEEYSMLTPRNVHTCTAFPCVPGSNTFFWYIQHTHKAYNPGPPPGNRACWGIMKNDEVPVFRATRRIPFTFHWIFAKKTSKGSQHNEFNQVYM